MPRVVIRTPVGQILSVRQRSEPVDDRPSGDFDGHQLLMHRNAQERGAVLTEWVLDGLAHHEQVIVADDAGETHGVLADHGVDVDAALTSGRLLLASPEACVEDHRVLVDRALDAAHRRVRLAFRIEFQERLLSDREGDEFEASLDESVGSRPFSVLCQCGLEGDRPFDAPIRRHHGRMYSRHLSADPGPDLTVLRGEVDLSNAASCTAAVSAAAGSCTGGRFRIDLSGLEFLGVAGCRSILDGTAEFRRNGGSVSLLSPTSLSQIVLGHVDLPASVTIEPASW